MNRYTGWKRPSFKPSSFDGRHNSTKGKCLWFLLNFDNDTGWTVASLARELGVNARSLSVMGGRWVNWGYVTRQYDGLVYFYRIADGGRKWLAKNEDKIPFARYQQEILEYRQSVLENKG